MAFCTAVLAQPASPSSAAADLATFHVQDLKLTCSNCHGDKTPTSVTADQSLTTANQNCIGCHGDAKSLAEKLAPRLKNKHVNPHASHLVQIDCVTCHRGHKVSEAFCLQCHAFDMPMRLKAKK